MDASDLPSVLARDARAFGSSRPAFLRSWLAQSRGRSYVHPGPDGVRGFTVARPCRQGVKIGPLNFGLFQFEPGSRDQRSFPLFDFGFCRQ